MLEKTIVGLMTCAVALWAIGCDGAAAAEDVENDAGTIEPGNWMPLDMGRQWRYTGQGSVDALTYTVESTQIVDGQEYAVVSVVHTLGSENSVSELLLRADKEGRILRLHNGQAHIWFDVTVPHGGTYTYPNEMVEGMDDYVVTVSRDQTAETEVGDFSGCLQFYFDIPPMADDELYYTMADEVGIVQLGGAWFDAVLIDFRQ